MKKIVAISLLLVIFINQLGYYFLHTLQQYQLKQEMRHALLSTIPESALELIAAEEHKGRIHWEERGKEFSLGGQMYDVVKTKMLNGKIFYFCLNDKKEQCLLDRFANLVKAGTDHDKGTRPGKNVVKFQLPDYEVPASETPAIAFACKQQYSNFISLLTFSECEIVSPPPKS